MCECHSRLPKLQKWVNMVKMKKGKYLTIHRVLALGKVDRRKGVSVCSGRMKEQQHARRQCEGTKIKTHDEVKAGLNVFAVCCCCSCC